MVEDTADAAPSGNHAQTWRPRHLGRISYGIYVLHLPIIGVLGVQAKPFLHRFLEEHGLAALDTSVTSLALFGGLSIVLAHLSYVLYELPMMKLGRRFIARKGRRYGPRSMHFGDGSPSQ